MTILLIVTLILVAVIIRATQARRKLQKHLDKDGITGEVLYTDDDGRAKTLVSHRYKLCGKPDYVVEEDGQLIPVEKKTRVLHGNKTYRGEVLQLAAYCLILEDLSGKKVEMGRLQYNNRTIDIPFGYALREALEQVLQQMREAEASADEQARSHDSPAKCGPCEFNGACPVSLAKNVARFG